MACLGVGEARARALDGFAHRLHRLVLTHDALVKLGGEIEKFLALALLKLGDGNAGPFRYDVGDVRLGDFVAKQRRSRRRGEFENFLRLLQLTLEFHQRAVLEFGRLVQIVLSLGALNAIRHRVDFFL